MKLSDFYEKNGVPSSQIIQALVWTRISGVVVFTLGIGLCYRYRPIYRLLKFVTKQNNATILETQSRRGIRYSQFFNNFVSQTQKIAEEKISQLANNSIVQIIPVSFGWSTLKFTVAFIEGVVLLKLLSPITRPSRYYIINTIFSSDSGKVMWSDVYYQYTRNAIDINI